MRIIKLICASITLLLCTAVTYANPVILILGDSLSTGYKLQFDEGWVDLLIAKLKQEQYDYTIVNGSKVGATTDDGIYALPELLERNQPEIVVLALGSNDGLRNAPIFTIKNNIAKLIDMSQRQNTKILLIGFELPLNYDATYRKEFKEIYSELSSEYKLPLVPFMLAGFAGNLNFFQNDNLHPNAAAQPLILNTVWPFLQAMLRTAPISIPVNTEIKTY